MAEMAQCPRRRVKGLSDSIVSKATERSSNMIAVTLLLLIRVA